MIRPWLRAGVAIAIAWGTAQSVVVGVLVASNHATAQRAALAAQRAADTADALADATCPFNRELATAPLTAQTGQIGRRLVENARSSYMRVCIPKYGPLPPPDPDSYQPAPTPTPGTQHPSGAPTTPPSPAPTRAPTPTVTSTASPSSLGGRPTFPDPSRRPAPTVTALPSPTVGHVGGRLCVDLPLLPICVGVTRTGGT